MTIQSGNFPELLWPGIMDLFGHEYQDYESLYAKVFSIKKSTKAFEKIQQVTRLGLASIKPEGRGVDYTDPMQGFQREYRPTVFGLGTSVTKEMVSDEQYDYISGLGPMLARSIRHTEEVTAWSVINDGRTTQRTADGVVLFSASHLRPTGGTFSNTLSVAADLTVASLETMLQEIMLAQDDQGLQIVIKPKALVVHPSQNFRARKILESSYEPFTADNQLNTLTGIFKQFVVSPWLADSDAFYIPTDIPNGLTFIRRWNTEISRDNEFDSENLKIKATGRWDVGATDPRGIFESPGA